MIMSTRELTIQLPEDIYDRLADKAKIVNQSVDEIALHSLRAGLPPTLDDVPKRFQDDLRMLDQLSNEMLKAVAQTDLSDEKVERYEQLLSKNQREGLTQSEQKALNTLREESDLLMLRRAYASLLVKWRNS